MKIEVPYVAECPSHPAAVKLLRDVLRAEGVAAEIREVLVTDETMATDLRFCGSPTIRINGRDILGASSHPKAFALSCRLYPALLRRCVAPSLRPARGTNFGAGHRYFGISGCCPEFGCDDQLLLATRFRGGSGGRRCERLLHHAASLAFGTLGRAELGLDFGSNIVPSNAPSRAGWSATFCFGPQWRSS